VDYNADGTVTLTVDGVVFADLDTPLLKRLFHIDRLPPVLFGGMKVPALRMDRVRVGAASLQLARRLVEGATKVVVNDAMANPLLAAMGETVTVDLATVGEHIVGKVSIVATGGSLDLSTHTLTYPDVKVTVLEAVTVTDPATGNQATIPVGEVVDFSLVFTADRTDATHWEVSTQTHVLMTDFDVTLLPVGRPSLATQIDADVTLSTDVLRNGAQFTIDSVIDGTWSVAWMEGPAAITVGFQAMNFTTGSTESGQLHVSVNGVLYGPYANANVAGQLGFSL
jgi:hypothetical protein